MVGLEAANCSSDAIIGLGNHNVDDHRFSHSMFPMLTSICSDAHVGLDVPHML